jgi:hypothetical protein
MYVNNQGHIKPPKDSEARLPKKCVALDEKRVLLISVSILPVSAHAHL